jgi:hypothetical protein
MFEKLKEMNTELDQLKAKHLEMSKAMFSEVSKQLFDKHSVLESFSWNQYTPYFNDGDECTFSANVDYPEVNGMEIGEDEMEETLVDYGSYDNVTRTYPNKVETPNPDFNPALAKASEDVLEFLQNVDEDVLRNMFGDHVTITVTKEGVDVSEYDHE